MERRQLARHSTASTSLKSQEQARSEVITWTVLLCALMRLDVQAAKANLANGFSTDIASEMSTAKDGIVLFELDQLDKKARAHITSGTNP